VGGTTRGYGAKTISILKDAMVYRFEKTKYWARVHFIPDLKVGEFVTLRAPYVLGILIKCEL